ISNHGRRSGICYGSKALITYSLFHLLHFKFGKVRVGEFLNSIIHLCDASMTSKSVALVRCIKPSLLFVKLNRDGRCGDGICGGVVVVIDSMGALIMPYSIPLGAGTINWAEPKAMLFGLKCCIEKN
ncbi:hypothetical protein EJD97_013150, partial [Solanum chilense]